MGAWMHDVLAYRRGRSFRALGVFAMPRQRADLFVGVVLERPAKRLFGRGVGLPLLLSRFCAINENDPGIRNILRSTRPSPRPQWLLFKIKI